MSKFLEVVNNNTVTYFRKDQIKFIQVYRQVIDVHADTGTWTLSIHDGSMFTSEDFGEQKEACYKRCKEILSQLEE